MCKNIGTIEFEGYRGIATVHRDGSWDLTVQRGIVAESLRFSVDQATGDTVVDRLYAGEAQNCDNCEYKDSDNWIQDCACCPLSKSGHHQYSDKTCPKCGRVFCYACCGGTNVDEGGKYDPDFMFCPTCGHDYYRD